MKIKDTLTHTAVIFLIIIAICLMIAFLLKAGDVRRQYEYYKSRIEKTPSDIQADVNYRLKQAIDHELRIRMKSPEVKHEKWIYPFDDSDTSDYVTRTIQTMDTTFQVRVYKWDGNAINKIHQFIFKGFKPVDLKDLDICIRTAMKVSCIDVNQTYFEYIDLKKNRIISHSNLKPGNCYESKIIPLDILKSTGIKTYVTVYPQPALWQYMKYEIAITALLIVSFLFTVLLIVSLIKKL